MDTGECDNDEREGQWADAWRLYITYLDPTTITKQRCSCSLPGTVVERPFDMSQVEQGRPTDLLQSGHEGSDVATEDPWRVGRRTIDVGEIIVYLVRY